MYATNYFENLILNVLRGTSATLTGTKYLALFSSNPGDAGALTSELSYSGYARRSVSFSVPAAMNGGMGIQNTSEITFPTPSAAAGTITHIGVMTAATAGTMLVYGPLSTPLTIGAGDAPMIAAGEVKWWLTGDATDAFRTQILNVLRGTTLSAITPRFAMYNGNPTAGGTELSGANYARLSLTFDAPTTGDGDQGRIVNNNTTSSNIASSNWGNWTYDVITSAATGGTILFAKPRSTAKTITLGMRVTIAPGSIILGLN